MKEIIKKDFARKIFNNSLHIVDISTGEVYLDVVNSKAKKICISYNFIKMNVDIKDYLIEKLGYNDYTVFLDLCGRVNKYNIVSVEELDKFFNKEVRMRKIRAYKELDLIKKIKLKGLTKSFYFISPYIVQKTSEVSLELLQHFKDISKVIQHSK